MIIVYIIIGYLISVVLSVISDILFILLFDDTYNKKRLKNSETIGDLLNRIHPCCWFPIINVAVCFSNILLGFLILICKILTTLRDKFLNIRIRRNKQ